MQLSECRVYRYDPSKPDNKGEFLRAVPGFPEARIYEKDGPIDAYGRSEREREESRRRKLKNRCKNDWDKLMPEAERWHFEEGLNLLQTAAKLSVPYGSMMWQIYHGTWGGGFRRRKKAEEGKKK